MTQSIRTIRIATQGPAGPHGLYPQANWNAGSVPYARATVLAHNGGVWLALRDTSVEPSAGAPDDWASWLDFSGYATLGEDGKIPTAQLPAIAITDTFQAASQAAMLALAAETGDIAVRSDLNKSFVLAADDPTVLANWKELLTPTDAVLSVAGRTGAVTLAQADISGLTTADSPAHVALSLSGQSLAGSGATPLLDLATAWNTSGDPTALKLVVANTASGSGANLVDIKLDTVSYLKLDKFGQGFIRTNLSFGLTGSAGTFGSAATLARVQGGSGYGFHATDGRSAADTALNSFAAGVATVTNGSTGGGALEFVEQTAPAAPNTDCVRIFAQDNGSGKTQLMAQFSSGAAVQIAIQP